MPNDPILTQQFIHRSLLYRNLAVDWVFLFFYKYCYERKMMTKLLEYQNILLNLNVHEVNKYRMHTSALFLLSQLLFNYSIKYVYFHYFKVAEPELIYYYILYTWVVKPFSIYKKEIFKLYGSKYCSHISGHRHDSNRTRTYYFVLTTKINIHFHYNFLEKSFGNTI
jgi:hypothetical protein